MSGVPPLPDLSHLTEEERKLIESVLQRQREEENKEQAILRKLQDDYVSYKAAVDKSVQQNQSTGGEGGEGITADVCPICHKTKLAEGSGQECSQCHLRTCSRCGSHMAVKAGKQSWVCQVCKKRLELLAKTGQWYHGGQDVPAAHDANANVDSSDGGQVKANSDVNNRVASTDQQDAQSHDRFSANGDDRGRNQGQQEQGQRSLRGSSRDREMSRDRSMEADESRGHRRRSPGRTDSVDRRHEDRGSRTSNGGSGGEDGRSGGGHHRGGGAEEDRRSRRSTSPQSRHSGDRDARGSSRGDSVDYSRERDRDDKNREGYSPRNGRRSLTPPDNSGGESRPTASHSNSRSRYDDERNNRQRPPSARADDDRRQARERQPERLMADGSRSPARPRDGYEGSVSPNRRTGYHDAAPNQYSASSPNRRHHLDPASATTRSGGRRPLLDDSHRNDSLSSDPSDTARSAPVSRGHQHGRLRRGGHRQGSLSSSDDELRTTSEYTSESESFSERGAGGIRPSGNRSENWRQDEILAAKIKKFLAHPVTWKPSADGRKVIGHMILHKGPDRDGSDIGGSLGLKVSGGIRTERGYLGAFINKVKRGSIADVEGHLKPGDEVLEWNGRNLCGRSFDEVYDIIFESKHEPQIELIVQRPIRYADDNMISSRPQPVVSSSLRPQHPKLTITSPAAATSSVVCGTIQLKLLYNADRHELVVTVLAADNLRLRDNGQMPNPYCKLYLLPERHEATKRRTRTVTGSCSPAWNQSFAYMEIGRADIQNRSLEITVFDYDRIGSGEYMGETIIYLGTVPLHDELVTYTLHFVDDNMMTVPQTEARDMFSPQTTAARFGDFDRHGVRDNGRNHGYRSQPASIGHSPIDPRLGEHAHSTATTPTFKRQLPYVPRDLQKMSRERVTQDLEWRARKLKERMEGQSLDNMPASSAETSYRPRNDVDNGHSSRTNYLTHKSNHPRNGSRNTVPRDRGLSPDNQDDDLSLTSDLSLSTPSEVPVYRRHHNSDFEAKKDKRDVAPKRLTRSLSNNDAEEEPVSGDAVSASEAQSAVTSNTSRRKSFGIKALIGLSRKSRSSSQLAGGTVNKKGKVAFKRSEEVGLPPQIVQQSSKDSSTEGSVNGSVMSGTSSTLQRQIMENNVRQFVEGLGPGQLVSRQVLGSPCLGEVQLGLADRKGHLEVEVIRARGLVPKPGSKTVPAPCMKVYLLSGKQCVEKHRTTSARHTLEPLYQQQLVFTEPYQDRILQVTCWGDYGRMERKVFMGVVQILLSDLDLTNLTIGWYKLYTSLSLLHSHTSPSLMRPSSMTSLDSASAEISRV